MGRVPSWIYMSSCSRWACCTRCKQQLVTESSMMVSSVVCCWLAADRCWGGWQKQCSQAAADQAQAACGVQTYVQHNCSMATKACAPVPQQLPQKYGRSVHTILSCRLFPF